MGNRHAKALRCKTCQRNLPASCFKYHNDKGGCYYEVWACRVCQGRQPTVARSLVCPQCGDSFETTHSRKIYCTTKCQNTAFHLKSRNRRYPYHKIFPKECAECGEPFYARRTNSLACSPECQHERDKRHDREHVRRKRIKLKEECPLFHWAEIQKLKAWRKANPERYRLIKRLHDKRRTAAMFANGECTFAKGDWPKLLKEHNYRCFYCFCRGGDLTRDHIIPLVAGGTHTWENIVPACRLCNSHKRTKPIEEFLGWIHNAPEWPISKSTL